MGPSTSRFLPVGFLACALLGLAPGLSAASPESAARIQANASALSARTLASDQAYRDLESLCDGVGNRLSGSEGYARAVIWGVKAMEAAGLKNIHTEKVMVPHWVRNHESARLLTPAPQDLSILGLGMSVPTPKGGITAEVVVVSSLEELAALPDAKVKGRIVLFEAPFQGYNIGSRVRFAGPSAAARKGAVAMLLRSVTTLSFDTPHTGTLEYDPDAPRIPAAAVTVENAMMMRRLWEKKEPLRVHLEMDCERRPDAEAVNILGEIPGASRPEEIVLVGGHLDSWDVGQGAQDDGVGIVLSLQAARQILAQGLKPQRTVRVVFFANEENGNRGGTGYLAQHRAEMANHVAAVETDSGSGLARGLSLELEPADGGHALGVLQGLAPLLKPLGADQLVAGFSGVDISPLIGAGVPCLGLEHDVTHYWEVHHSKADTFDKVNKEDLARNAAILAVSVYALADQGERLRPAAR